MRKTHTLRGLEEDALDLLDVIQALRALLPEDTRALREDLFRALERDDPSGALNAAREAYERHGVADRDVALTYVVLLQSRGLLDEAEGVLRKTLVAHEQDVRVQLAQVRGLGMSGRTEQAGDVLDGLITYVTDPEMLGYAGDLSLDFEQTDAAIAAYKKALELASQDHEVAYRLARLLLERGEIFDGASMLERSARLAVAQTWLWELTGDAWTEADEPQRAAEAYGRAVKLEDEDEQLWLKRGMALHASGSWREAIEALERASRLDPFFSEAWIHMGHVYLDQGYAEDAVRWYKKALAETPNDLQALQGVTAAVFAQGDIEYAYDLAKRALEIDPNRMETQYNVGMILTEMSEHAQARASLERAAEISPESPEVWSVLALCRARTGDEEKAREAFELAVSLEPRDVELRLTFAQELIGRRWLGLASEVLDDVDTEEPAYLAAHAMMRYALVLLGEGEGAEGWSAAFDEALGSSEDPLDVDFATLDRLTLTMPRDESTRRLSRMVRDLESL